MLCFYSSQSFCQPFCLWPWDSERVYSRASIYRVLYACFCVMLVCCGVCLCLCLLDNTQRSPVIMSYPAVTPCMSVWCKAAEFLAECVRQGLSDAVSHRQDECGLYREKPWRIHANQQKPKPCFVFSLAYGASVWPVVITYQDMHG